MNNKKEVKIYIKSEIPKLEFKETKAIYKFENQDLSKEKITRYRVTCKRLSIYLAWNVSIPPDYD